MRTRLRFLTHLHVFEDDGVVARKEGQVLLAKLRGHVRFPPVIFGRVLISQGDDQVQIHPHIMVLLDMLLESTALGVERKAIDATDEALRRHTRKAVVRRLGKVPGGMAMLPTKCMVRAHRR